ncbi:copper homeostasis protein CutC, partial [Bacteroidota bacterium]
TPAFELIEALQHSLKIPVRAMIRPRAGNFVYSTEELDTIFQAIDHCKRVGIDGVVFGVLTARNELDLEMIRELVRYASPLRVTIHKAVDQTPNPVTSIGSLLRIPGIHSVLTSGGAQTAYAGINTLQNMINAASDKVEVIVAGKVTNHNYEELHTILNAKAYHGRRIVGELSGQ